MESLDYSVADNSIEWMKKIPEDKNLYEDGGTGMSFSNAGGRRRGRKMKRGKNIFIDPTIDTNVSDQTVPDEITQDGMPGSQSNTEFSNAGGYGFWCNKKCAADKAAAGIPPLGGNKAAKAANNAAAIAALNAPDNTAATLAAIAGTGTNTGAAKGGAGAKAPTKSNTMLYVGIGVGVLVLGGVAFWYFKIRKK